MTTTTTEMTKSRPGKDGFYLCSKRLEEEQPGKAKAPTDHHHYDSRYEYRYQHQRHYHSALFTAISALLQVAWVWVSFGSRLRVPNR